ncbi:hypothetical protein [Spirosoma sp. KNUC1025]|uniref:hypothetical protein n=1 Tax=Spirosoma sp. KNUC1025 TaxID=2894082 RepID=UPI0038631C9C|nr:hypothetical protein LN737_18995 [Spirosoma sp. KNUC1025]
MSQQEQKARSNHNTQKQLLQERILQCDQLIEGLNTTIALISPGIASSEAHTLHEAMVKGLSYYRSKRNELAIYVNVVKE